MSEEKDLIDISGLSKPEVLAALYNASKQQGAGFLDPKGSQPMDQTQAETLVGAQQGYGGKIYFDYVNGRVMKIDITNDTLCPRLYDRDNGPGAAAKALTPLIASRQSTGTA